MTTYRARCGALIVRDVSPGPFVSVRNRLADYLEAQAQAPPPRNGNVHAATIFHINANRVRLWQEEGTYLASQFVKIGDRRYRIEVDPTATDPDELTIELEAE